MLEIGRGGRQHQRRTGSLSERAEEIGTHASNVSYIIAHVVRNAGGIPIVVFFKTILILAREVCTDIRSLCVDASAHTPEQSDGGAAEAITGNGLIEFFVLQSRRFVQDQNEEIQSEDAK